MNDSSHGERGAVAVVVAVLMTALLGFAAIGVDVANMASDKQQLQDGADAAALAIAQECATGETTCNNTAGNLTSSELAASNRLDGAAVGVVVTPVLQPATGEVTVRATGTTNHWFAPLFGNDATEINAEATAVWEPPVGAASLPITISLCELLAQNGVTPVYDENGDVIDVTFDETVWADPEHDYMVFYMTGGGMEDSNGCPLSGASGSIPGGFAHLDAEPGEEEGSCYANTEIGDDDIPSVGSDPGNGPDSDCENDWFISLLFANLGEPILIPVFNAVEGTGQNATYSIFGYASFELYAYYLNPGQYSEFSDPLDGKPCKGNDRCIAGKFVEWVFPQDLASVGGPAPDLGAIVIRLTK